jgi:hypothetical protein
MNSIPYFPLHVLIPATLVRWLILNPLNTVPSELKQMEREISLFQKPKAISRRCKCSCSSFVRGCSEHHTPVLALKNVTGACCLLAHGVYPKEDRNKARVGSPTWHSWLTLIGLILLLIFHEIKKLTNVMSHYPSI